MLVALTLFVGAVFGALLGVVAKKLISGIDSRQHVSQAKLVVGGFVVGVALAFLVVARFAAWDQRAAYAALSAGLVLQTMIDAFTHRLVRSITHVMALSGVVFLGLNGVRTNASEALVSAMICAVVGWTMFLVVNRISPGGVGSGAVRLVPVLGWYLGFLGYSDAIYALFIASATAGVVGVVLIVAKSGSLKRRLAFGPYLAFGTLIGVFAGEIFPTVFAT